MRLGQTPQQHRLALRERQKKRGGRSLRETAHLHRRFTKVERDGVEIHGVHLERWCIWSLIPIGDCS